MSVIPTYHNNNTETLELKSMQTEWGPRLNLEYPTLTGSAVMPFVLFKVVRADGSSVNPSMQLNPNGEESAVNRALLIDTVAQRANQNNENAVRNEKRSNEIKLYPNPTSDYVNLEIANWEGKTYFYSISNSMGQVLISNALVKDKVTKIDISKFQKGVYQVEVISKDKVINLQLVVL